MDREPAPLLAGREAGGRPVALAGHRPPSAPGREQVVVAGPVAQPVGQPRHCQSEQALHMPGIGISSTISIELSGIMKCGCSFIVAASASFDSACMIE